MGFKEAMKSLSFHQTEWKDTAKFGASSKISSMHTLALD